VCRRSRCLCLLSIFVFQTGIGVTQGMQFLFHAVAVLAGVLLGSFQLIGFLPLFFQLALDLLDLGVVFFLGKFGLAFHGLDRFIEHSIQLRGHTFHPTLPRYQLMVLQRHFGLRLFQGELQVFHFVGLLGNQPLQGLRVFATRGGCC
jgi:hypothetical protein